jgi:hypothetical protein|tara:strand:+ start:1442 stop:1636 length:195 start_codon:yes stop_codon:yes gene_type:complete
MVRDYDPDIASKGDDPLLLAESDRDLSGAADDSSERRRGLQSGAIDYDPDKSGLTYVVKRRRSQ